MEIKLQGIGIFKNSTSIKLDGLTVISGENNSGKSTVGKVLYSIFESLSDIENKIYNDAAIQTYNDLNRLNTSLTHFCAIQQHVTRDKDNKIKHVHVSFTPEKLMTRDYEIDFSSKKSLFTSLQKFLILIKGKLDAVSQQDHLKAEQDNDSEDDLFLKVSQKKRFYKLKESYDAIEEQFYNLSNGHDFFYNASDSHEFFNKYVEDIFRQEFNNELHHQSLEKKESYISIEYGDLETLNLTILENKVSHNNDFRFYIHSFDKVYLIDDAYIIDEVQGAINETIRDAKRLASTLPNIKRQSHRDSITNTMIDIFSQEDTSTIAKKIELEKSLEFLQESFSSIIPGNFSLANTELRYSDHAVDLNVRNLATGSKMFALLKIFLTAGKINSSTLLILDEPEAHLHPSWQNEFAKLIVMLVKALGVKILLTTHSPNFLLAIDAYMREYEIEDLCNFYQTETSPEGITSYTDYNEDMEKLYEQLLQPYLKVKAKRSKHV